MPEHERYDKFKTESKIFMNVIKMISYRAETVLANLLAPCLTKTPKEKRMVVKQIIKSSIDLIPDYLNKTLTVKLYSLVAGKEEQMETIRCPRCNNYPRLQKAVHPRDKNVVLDYCPYCKGIWLDKGELEAIQQESWLVTVGKIIKCLSGHRDPHQSV